MSNNPEVVVVIDELRKATIRLSDGSKQVFTLAKNRAASEQAYRRELAKSIMRLRSEGVQATLIPDLSRGECADLKFQRDLDNELHRSAMSSIGALQVEIQSWQSILKIMNEV